MGQNLSLVKYIFLSKTCICPQSTHLENGKQNRMFQEWKYVFWNWSFLILIITSQAVARGDNLSIQIHGAFYAEA